MSLRYSFHIVDLTSVHHISIVLGAGRSLAIKQMNQLKEKVLGVLVEIVVNLKHQKR